MTQLSHAERLKKMATFTRELVEVARKYNGSQPHWEAERTAEAQALEAGAQALDVTGEITKGLDSDE